MSAQKPMAVRKQEMLVRLSQHNGCSVHVLDRKVLNRLIKQGLAKIINTNSRAAVVNGRKWVMANTAQAVATNPIPLKVDEPKTAGPYAKRKAAAEEAGLPYRGKTWGKIRVDLPREEREKRLKDKDLMWAKLKKFR